MQNIKILYAFLSVSLQAVRRARSSIGCCINNYFEYVENLFDAINTTPGAR